MNNTYKILFTVFLITAFILLGDVEMMGQCPMCRMSAETNLENGGTEGRGLNKGILYMLSLPYLLVASLGLIWWKNRNRLSDEIVEEPFSDN